MPVWLSIMVLVWRFCTVLLRQLNAQQSRTHVVDWSMWIAISSLPSFKGKVEKKQITKLGCEKYFYGTLANLSFSILLDFE